MMFHCIKKPLLLLPLALLALLIVACGTASATTTGAASTTTTTAATKCPATATGTVKSVSNNTLLFTNRLGTDVQVSFNSATVFVRQSTGTTADLKEGTSVTTTVQQGTNNTYSALTISLRSGAALTASRLGATGSLRSCTGTSQRRTGTGGLGGTGSGLPGVFGTAAAGRQSLSGTIAQLNGNALVITDASGNDFSLLLTTTTRISKTETVSASDLSSGETVTVLGTANSQGVLQATYVLITTRVTRTTNG